MKNLQWVWIALAAAMIVGCSQPEGAFTIRGKLKGLSGDQIFLMVDNEIIDSATIKNDRFTLRGTVEQSELGILLYGEQNAVALVFIEPGKLKVTGDIHEFESVDVSGSPLNEKYYGFVRGLSSLQERYAATDDPAEQAAIIAELDSMETAFMDANLDNLVGVFSFVSGAIHMMDAEQIESTIARFTPEMQRTSLMNDAREQLGRAVKASVGALFTEVAMPDRNGKTIALSDVVGRNKYVLLDFWASWCDPCMRELPYLKSAYERFGRKGFEIYGVTLDSDQSKWFTAMDGNGMNWANVGSFESSGVPAADDYGVVSIPTNFLIRGDGTIVARDLRGEALSLKLEELLP